MAPAVGIAVAGGPVLAPARRGIPDGAAGHPPERTPRGSGIGAATGLTQAGPVAIAGMIVNGAAALVVVAVARLVTPQSYGDHRPAARSLLHPLHAWLGGAGRRGPAGDRHPAGGDRAAASAGGRGRVHRLVLVAAMVAEAGRGRRCSRAGSPRQLSLPQQRRGGPHPRCGRHLDPALGRPRAPAGPPQLPGLAGNLLVEGGVRTASSSWRWSAPRPRRGRATRSGYS